MKTTEITIKDEEVLKLLKNALSNSEHKDAIAETIMLHISKSTVAMQHVFKSFLGLVPSSRFKIGDECLVTMSSLPTWRMKVDLMKEKNMLHKNHLYCTVEEINLERYTSLKIRFSYYDTNEVLVEDTYEVKDDCAVFNDEFIERNTEDLLPF